LCLVRQNCVQVQQSLSPQSTDERLYDIRTRVLKVLIVLLLFVSEEEVNFASDTCVYLDTSRGQKSGSILEAGVGFVCLDGGCCVLIA
jgi:hypothetical protein